MKKTKGRVRLTKWQGAIAVLVHFHGLGPDVRHCRLLGMWYTASSRKYRIRLLEVRDAWDVKRRGKPSVVVIEIRELLDWTMYESPKGETMTFAEQNGKRVITIIAPTTPLTQ